ncbi:MAG: 50S ribosomal protein L19 [Dehalococcoidia bacterium]|nr:50S ribosomal protein L19 [Dehalococcoidia bacterium]
MDIKTVSQVKPNPNIAQVSPGDTVRVSFRVKEANRERLQTLLGLVVRVRRGANGGNFTVRRVTYGVGVEHTFPFASPLLEKVEVVRHGKVRRAKLYYIRRLSAKEARLKERREKMAAEVVVGKAADEEAADEEGTVDEAEVQEDIVGEAAAAEVEVEQAAAEETERAE